MAEREIAGMVEKSMGAGGGDVTPEEDSLNIELPSTLDDLPEGLNLLQKKL